MVLVARKKNKIKKKKLCFTHYTLPLDQKIQKDYQNKYLHCKITQKNGYHCLYMVILRQFFDSVRTMTTKTTKPGTTILHKPGTTTLGHSAGAESFITPLYIHLSSRI